MYEAITPLSDHGLCEKDHPLQIHRPQFGGDTCRGKIHWSIVVQSKPVPLLCQLLAGVRQHWDMLRGVYGEVY